MVLNEMTMVGNMTSKLYRAIGLMTGTSIDGIDAAVLETDGHNYVRPLCFMPNPYDRDFRTRLRGVLGKSSGTKDSTVAAFERELTELHAAIVGRLQQQFNGHAANIDLIGFHGQTIWHQPAKRMTIQIGDGALLAKLTKIPVVNDFRSADVKAGGHGAPLVPLYHRALATKLPKPVVILNIGGVANVTWIGGASDDEILAFDVGPGNAMIDDWVLHHTGSAYDEHGLLAASGHADMKVVDKMLAKPFFRKKPPKSIDRDMFKNFMPTGMKVADGAATLTMITAHTVAASIKFMPEKPRRMYVAGGGRLNHTLLRWIADLAEIPVTPVDDLGWSGDGLEAEAFGYLAVRSHLGLPLSVPGTTGVPLPMTGGRFWEP
jgi:anhydro-N-acetylmuramic acid kinase